ncbi:rapsyn protein 1 [Loa loa]|uniref:Rapsyn protein 1 n=1 Tax=Loa loa TaxID=7209 RepID=A0A1S0U8H2_LOALO|nr:rapsyn protein 1 [Loa loa]EFO26927.2 rapsyn protein 1 [Loa loa]
MGIRIEDNWISMGQRVAKHHMQSGVKLYHQRRHQQAIARWRAALRRLTNAEDRFITLGYMTQTYCDAGNYQQMLRYALQQTELANTQQDEFMKSEAFLNLAKAYERLADFGKAIGYGRASLQHPSMDPGTPGHAHLVVALSQLGFSQFQASLEAFEKAMCVANQYSDRLLELQVCVGLGVLFTLLRDLSKAILFLRNALTILEGVTINDVHAKYRSVILYHLSVVLRTNGSLADARATCDEAMKLAQETGNRSVYARCLCSMANICRDLGESEAKETFTKSWSRYEEAYRIMRQTNDRMGEILVLGSMARSASEYRTFYTGRCECQAIQLNKKCLEVAKAIGCRDLYNQLNDEDSEELARRAVTSLTQEMELFCNFCGQRYGLQDVSLQALRCSHIFHERCLQIYLAECLNPNCPKCQCKAVLMDSVSVSTLSVSSFIATPRQPIMFSEDIPVQFTDQTTEPFGTVRSSAIEQQASCQRHLSVPLSHPTFRELKTVQIDVESPRTNATAVSTAIGSSPMNTLSNSQKHKSLPPSSKLPVCKVAGTLPISSVLNYSEEELRAGGPSVLPRGLTITDV